MKQHTMSLAVAWLAPLLAATPTAAATPLETVEHVDLQRYTGTWYEIASFPQRFQRGCHGTTATYSLRQDGDIDIVNRCRKDSLSGPEAISRGRAWVVDHQTNAKLKIQFFWPFSGDYWIIQLGENYEYAVVGHPSRKYLWILSRTPRMDEARYAAILDRLKEQGYDLSPLQRIEQPPAQP